MKCIECNYTIEKQHKHGVTSHCSIEPTLMDVTYHIIKNSYNTLCPFVCKRCQSKDLDYDLLTTDSIKKHIEEYNRR